jgi:catalase
LSWRRHLGVNYKQILINQPRVPALSCSKDGVVRVQNVSDPVHAPNSKGGPPADSQRYPEVEVWKAGGEWIRAAYTLRKGDDDWGQAGALVRKVTDQARERYRLLSNVVGDLKKGLSQPVLQRAFEYWRNIR